MAETTLQITTINNYFGKDFEGIVNKLNSQLLSYKFPLQICLSSI